MLLFTAFLWNLVRFLAMAGFAVGGVFLGIFLRKRKDAKEIRQE